MKIETELNIGDIMYVVEAAESKAVVKERKIVWINAIILNEEELIFWYFDEYDNPYTSNLGVKGLGAYSFAFKTFEEAQAYANKLNNGEKE